MAWTSVGFDGTITEIQWAGLAGLLGNGYVAAGNSDCLVTAVPGARSVSVAAGSLYGDGVLSTNSGAETVALTTPVNGQWYVIALRRTWATNTAALVAIAGATTTTTTPTAPPTSFPTLNTNVGVLTDQPIAWAWCNSANTTVVVYDIRLKAVKSMPPVVASAAERDAKFMSPTQGLQVWRNDYGTVETYYELYNASTNPGGATPAGWYPDKAVQIVKRNNVATNINAGTYGGYYNNTIWEAVTSTGNFAAYSNGFTVPYTGIYNISFHMQGSANLTIAGFLVNSTTSPGSWTYLRAIATANGLAAMQGDGNYKFTAGDRIYLMIYTNTTYLWDAASATMVDPGTMKLEFLEVAR